MKEFEMEQKMHELGKLIGLEDDSNLYPMVTTKDDLFPDGSSLYYSRGKYHYVGMDRGEEVEHHKARDLTEIMYWVFETITFSIANDYELRHRNENEDPRRQLFSKQLELLGKISPQYRMAEEKEIKEILKEAPFRDEAFPLHF